ncbi:hypothetical protein BUALT_Bualt01G0005100 [Buddleja alternifolia]|uniref:Uncharacterized protein n=1 Tax=Buddleja alternifolia TaxID=168488 RepID=A0AAV6Y3E3_9LAMI|nr:hypothetical protein BUALT_Bualt01G0005100 [Buddleja alternifolia]
MLGKTVASPLLRFDPTVCFNSYPAHISVNVNLPIYIPRYNLRGNGIANHPTRDWELHSTAQIHDPILSNEDNKKWESCKQALSTYGFANDEQEKILGKAFGRIHSPYWGEERKVEVPKFEIVSEILSYLKDLGLTDDDIGKFLKKFPEVLGCSLENEVKANVGILEKEWGIKGKTLRSLLIRNPKVLGYNIDCKGDCMAQCTRCWVRF